MITNVRKRQPLNKAFTLIELLAVIVILSIIALIATPIVLNIIKDSKEESNKRSVEMYVKAIQNANASKQLDGNLGIVGKFDTSTLDDKLKVDYEGNVVCDVIEVYEDGKIYITECKVNGEPIKYTYGKDQSYDNGQIVYFDVVKGKGCTEREYKRSLDTSIGDYLNSSTGYNGIKDDNDTSNKNSCLKFYAFNDNINSKSLNLLLDHNTTARIAWLNSTEKLNDNIPMNVLNQLKKDTEVWNGTEELKDYKYLGSKSYIISYNEYNARLITAQEIARITGANKKETLNFKEENSTIDSWYYLDGLVGTDSKWQEQVVGLYKQKKISEYYWLFDRTAGNCKLYGCKVEDSKTYGYWTSTVINMQVVHNIHAYGMFWKDELKNNNLGVRPVIEVLKSNL